MKISDYEQLINDIVDATIKIIKQSHIKDIISSLEFVKDSDFYAFPPTIILGSSEKQLELNFWELKNKELHYRIDAISGETNIDINGDIEKSTKIYTEIISRLKKHKLENICKISGDFKILVR